MTVYDIKQVGMIILPDRLDKLLDEYKEMKGYSSRSTVIMSAIGKVSKQHLYYGHIKNGEPFNKLLEKEYYFNLSEMALFALKDLFEKENIWGYKRFTGSRVRFNFSETY